MNVKEPYSKGHKSRNSMFPKSYTYQRRENDVYYKNPIKQRRKEDGEEKKVKNINETKSSNPYTNINPYENDNTNPKQTPKESQVKYVQLNSDK